MGQRARKVFFACPETPHDLANPIRSASSVINASSDSLHITVWPQVDSFGTSIADEIRNQIKLADTIVCDITLPNTNVYYETGFAIGLGKAIAPVANISFADYINIQKDGLFDTISFKKYEKSRQLCTILQSLPASCLAELYSKEPNRQQPLFFLDTYSKTDFRNDIVSAIKDSRIFYRSFDPVEETRLSTIWLIGEISASTGVIVPVLSEHLTDAKRHNLRGAFIAGLSHGFKRETLLLRYPKIPDADPIDYRDIITSVRSQSEIANAIADLSKNAFIASQSIGHSTRTRNRTTLQQLSLGASAAENEFRVLEDYFIETSEYLRTLRGEIALVTGRKGTGKTAIFFRVRDVLRSRNDYIVVDLKPESHQLSRFREELLKISDKGVFDHTLAAFWYYIIISEVILKIRDKLSYSARHDPNAITKVNDIDNYITSSTLVKSGDFTHRINSLGKTIVDALQRLHNEKKFSPELLTNIVFRDGIKELRSVIFTYVTSKIKIIVLFDNIDKGWPADGVHEFDVRSVRLLVESLETIRRDLNAQGREFSSVVFLRNDIYNLLVKQTPDRGKSTQVSIDWTDRAKLRQLIFMRLRSNTSDESIKFDQLWSTYFISNIGAQHSFDYFADHCLMRPRFLIKAIENAVANAINRGHIHVEEVDCIDAVTQRANDLLSDFGYEIRDVSGITADILYGFIGSCHVLTRAIARAKLHELGIDEGKIEHAIWLMLWYGIIGVETSAGIHKYIYDYQYDMKRIEADIRPYKDDARLVINPAIYVALR